MELKSWINGNVKILSLYGNFDVKNAFQVGRWIEAAVTTRPACVVVDLNGVKFIDSTALTILVRGKKRAVEGDGDLLLCKVNQPVRMIFELTRLDQVFEFFIDEEDAVAAFNQRQVPVGHSLKENPGQIQLGRS